MKVYSKFNLIKDVVNTEFQMSYQLPPGGSRDSCPWYVLMGLEDAPSNMTLPNDVINATNGGMTVGSRLLPTDSCNSTTSLT